MDPLSLTCNIVGVLTVASQLISMGYSYGSSVGDFPEEVRNLIGELTSLSGILSALRAVVDQPPPYQIDGSMNPQPSLIAEFLNDPLEECGKSLQSLLKSLENQRVGSKMQKIFKRVTWPLKDSETKDLFSRLERYKQTFSLALSADEVTLTRSICNDIQSIKRNKTTDAERKELAIKNEMLLKILSWLSAADPEVNHVAARQLQQFGTGRWFTDGETYRNWLSPDHSFLWLHGKPGAGKTILSSMIIDRVMSEIYTSSNVTPAVIYFYCDFKDSSKQTAVSLLGSLISQLVQKRSEIPTDLENLYRRLDNGHKLPEIYSLESCLHSIIKQFSKVVVIIDALDEFMERDPVFEMLERLRGNINILITSRDELDIKLQFEGLPNLAIKESDVSADIERFVTYELDRQPKLNRLKPTTKSDIIHALVGGASGMFRWAKCCLDEIGKLRNDKAIKAALKSLPRTLGDSYERILCSISEEDRTLAIRIFQWLLSSQRPMKMWEIVDALAVEVGDVSMDPDSKLNEPEDITHICGGLVDLNRWNMTLGLAHFTVREYLISTSIAEGPAAAYRIRLEKANTELTKICLTYILFDDFDAGPCETADEFLDRLEEYPLLRYAPYYWPNHISEYKSGTDKILDDLVLSFFRLKQDSSKFLAWNQIRHAGATNGSEWMNDYKDRPPTLLYAAAEMGQLQAVKELLEGGADIDVDFKSYGTPLVVAASNGHPETVQFLLEKGAGSLENSRIKKEHRLLHNPMNKAALNGFPECVQILLDYGGEVNPEWVKCCETAISSTALHGHENVMEVFLGTDYFSQVPTIEEADNNIHMHPFLMAFTACIFGAWEKPIRSLWEMGYEVMIQANENKLLKFALMSSAMYGHIKILKMILQKDEAKAACAQRGLYHLTLQIAAYFEQEKVIEFLLGLGEISEGADMGLSLHIAAAKGHIGIIERLLSAGANPLHKDEDGWSPLVYASQYGEDSAVEKLSISSDFPDASEYTNVGPTSWILSPGEASIDGHEMHAEDNIVARALHPISPLCASYSFEVKIIEGNCWAIGFADPMHNVVELSDKDTFENRPGSCNLSWGYNSEGTILFDDRQDTQKVEGYGVGDVVGCHFDRTKYLAFFTVNGKIVGKPIAGAKGKLVPTIGLSKKTRIRTNFGDGPLAYPMPSLSAEMLSDTWTPSDAWWSVGLGLEPPKPIV